jgi:hypothetical protein
VATPVCGWEVDDVVLRLQDEPGLFDQVDAVEHRTDFDADIRFADQTAAQRLASLLRSQRVPGAMSDAIEQVSVSDRTVTLRFRPVEEVRLTQRGPDHVAACVLGERLSS